MAAHSAENAAGPCTYRSRGMNITDPILFQCRHQPDAAALCVPGRETVSYARLEKQINNVARRAMALGLSRGKIVALSVADMLVEATLILGLSRLGVVAVSLHSRKLPIPLRVDAILSDAKYSYAADARQLPVDFSWVMGDGKPIQDPRPASRSFDDVCRIHLTSGTTGDAKAVAFTNRMLFERIARHEFLFGNRLPACSRIFLNVGLATAFGFRFLLHGLWRGGTLFFPGDRLESTLQAFERDGIQAMISAPYGLAKFLEFCGKSGSFQSRLDVIIAAGSYLSAALSEQARARLCPNLISAYGSTETNTIATAPAQVIAGVPGAVGYVAPDVTVEILDGAGRQVPDGTEGIVRLRSPYSVSGYLGDAEETATAFRDGWFYPGDVGRVTRDGLLIIAGREKEILNLGGAKLKPQSIEQALASFPGVVEAAAFGVANGLGIDEPWAAIVCRAKVDESELRAHCRRLLPGAHVPVRFVTVDALPRNETGKLDRTRLVELAKLH